MDIFQVTIPASLFNSESQIKSLTLMTRTNLVLQTPQDITMQFHDGTTKEFDKPFCFMFDKKHKELVETVLERMFPLSFGKIHRTELPFILDSERLSGSL